MSEYQYYEFLALDRPLTDRQLAELRSLSTRAEISATRFVNEYQWGNFRGDPRAMMERYFDAFLYLANWGAREAAARAAVYTQRLDEFATRQEAAWKRADTLIETKNPPDYDTAVTLLSDLRALAERHGDKAAFTDRFLSLREQHQRKPSLQERFDKAGLPRRA